MDYYIIRLKNLTIQFISDIPNLCDFRISFAVQIIISYYDIL